MQEVLDPLFVGQVPIKPIHTHTKFLGQIQQRGSPLLQLASYFTEADAPVLPEEKEDGLADWPRNVSHYTAVLYHCHGEGVLGIGKFRC